MWEAFSELNYRRGIGMSGPVPITMEAIEAYCRFRYISSPYDRDRFLIYIRALDQEWMSAHYSKQQAQADKNGPTADPKRLNLTRPK